MACLVGLGQRVLLYLLLVQLGAMSLLWNIVAWLLYRVLPRAVGTRIGRVAIGTVYRIFWASAKACGMMRIETAGIETLADEPGGLIIAANHPTMFDALVLVARLPRGVCIMKAELLRNPFVGPGARLARYIRNDSARGMIRCAIECLQQGGQLVMFPEGTRTVRPPVDAFRSSVTLIAAKAKAPIQTVIIEADSPYLRKGWPIWKAPVFPVVVRARLGRRFEPSADHQALLVQLERYFVAELMPARALAENAAPHREKVLS